MIDFIEIPIENIIKESFTEYPGYGDKQYIVYKDPNNSCKKIRVNTYYFRNETKARLCIYYDRGLCNTLEEYSHLSKGYIESQAYGSWMDGAR